MMFREMRRKDRQVFEDVIEEVLAKGEYGILSTIDDNGYPYGIPVNYVYIEKSIFFHCAKTGHKLDNIAGSDKVSFCVITDTELLPEAFSTKYKSVIAFGTASETHGEIKRKALMGLVKKYAGELMEKGRKHVEKDHGSTIMVQIQIQHITGKARV